MSAGVAERVAIGRVVRPHGRHGEVVVEPWTDTPGRFPGLRHAFLRREGSDTEVTVAGCRAHQGRYLLKLEGVDSIDDAEQLRDGQLTIDESEVPALPAGSYYHYELIGMQAERLDGAPLGRVASLMETGGTPVLCIEGDRGELLVPLAERYLSRVDVAEGRLILDLSEWGDAAD